MSLDEAIFIAAINGDSSSPKLSKSSNYKHWLTLDDLKRCYECETKHGKTFSIDEVVEPEPPILPNCRCWIEIMKTIQAGTAIVNGYDGADWSLKYNKLPDYYVTKKRSRSKRLETK